MGSSGASFNKLLNADPSTPHQPVVATLIPQVATSQLGRLAERYVRSAHEQEIYSEGR